MNPEMQSGFAAMSKLLSLVILITMSCVLDRSIASDELLADFEQSDYGAWKVTGDAFGAGPAQGTLPNQMPVSGFLGHGLVNSYLHGDASTGTLTSPEFTIRHRYVNFLI